MEVPNACLSPVSSSPPHYSTPGSFCLYLSCVLWSWLLCSKESLITIDFLPACLPVVSLWYSRWHLVSSRTNILSNELKHMRSGEVTAPTRVWQSGKWSLGTSWGFGWGWTQNLLLDNLQYPPVLYYYSSSFCKMFFSDNFRSSFPTQLPATKVFYMEILEPWETVKIGK